MVRLTVVTIESMEVTDELESSRGDAAESKDSMGAAAVTFDVPAPQATDVRIGAAKGNCALMITLQALLLQFTHPRVRADIVNGIFSTRLSSRLLAKLDELRWTLFPNWKEGSLQSAVIRNERAAHHLNLLMSKSSRLLELSPDDSESLTYREWFDILEDIAKEEYWARCAVSERCTHMNVNTTPRNNGSKTRIEKSNDDALDSNSLIFSSSTNSVKKLNRKKKSKKVVEEIVVLSSSDSDSVNDSVSSSRDSSSSSDDMIGHSRRSAVSHRKVVKPPCFDPSNRESLKQHFRMFDAYFDKKFDGSPYDKTQELSKFLQGDILNVYKIMGGRKVKYDAMRSKLLSWYKKQ